LRLLVILLIAALLQSRSLRRFQLLVPVSAYFIFSARCEEAVAD
jgi:hypothetical protein